MTISTVQSKGYFASAAAVTHNVTLDSEPTAGNLLHLTVQDDITNGVVTPSGWTAGPEVTDGFNTIAMFHRKAVAGMGTTLSFDLGASGLATAFFIEKHSTVGTLVLDQVGETTVDDGGTGTSGTTTANDEWAVGAVGDDNNGDKGGLAGTNYSAWSNSFTELFDGGCQTGGSNPVLGVAERVLTTTGTYSTTPTGGSNSGVIATFKELAAGTISFDAISENSTTDATSFTVDTNWTHTPVGTPASVIVIITQPLSAADEIAGITYGGVTMTRLITQSRAVTEVMRVWIYGLFASIPSGAQTVAVDVTGTAAKHGFVFTDIVEGQADGWTIAQDSENSADLGIIANPSITVTHTGTLSGWAGYAAHGYGGAAVVTTGLQTGETYRAGHDPGAAVAMTYSRHGGANAASSTFGYTTLASDDQVIAAVVLKGVAPAAAKAPPPPRRFLRRA